MDIALQLVPLLFGILFGAILGVLITDIPGHSPVLPPSTHAQSPLTFAYELHSDASSHPNEDFYQTGFSYLKIFTVILLLAIWIGFVCFWALSNSSISEIIRYRYGFIGSLIGFAGAPWVWLHFSRNFLSAAERSQSGAADILREYLARYQLLTIVLGIVLLLVILGPKFFELFSKAKSVAFLGVSLTVSDSGALESAPSSPLLYLNLPAA